MKKLINQIQSAARAFSSAAVALAVGVVLIGFTSAAKADQPPYIGAFYDTGYPGIDWRSSINNTNYTANEWWDIQLGSPSILCDNIEWQVVQNHDTDPSLIELQDSDSGPSADWIYYDSGTGGSTRDIWVLDIPDSTFQNAYFLTYGTSSYSDCWEQGGYVHIYNP